MATALSMIFAPANGRTRRRALALAAVLAAAAGGASAGEALNGFDAVSLVDSGRTVPGRRDIATHWRGSEWLFANEANRAAFEADPRSYAPALGGNCAVALAEGRKERGDPGLFVVVQGRIYLARNRAAHDVLSADPQGVVARATAIWKQLGR